MAEADGVMTTAPREGAEPAYRLPSDAIAEMLATDLRSGLGHEDAAKRLDRYGANELTSEAPVPAWRRFVAQFQDVLVILLLVATAISAGLWVLERDTSLPYEALAIFTVVILNATMGYIQEARAEAAAAALQALSAAHATVVRNGERHRLPATRLVPGDVILIEEGDAIPADARVIDSSSLQTSEASLTGESVPVVKQSAPIPEEAALADRDNMVFSGTAATYGHGRAVVTATGMRTEMGQIAGLLQDTQDETTPLQRELDRTGKTLGLVVVIIAVVMIGAILFVQDVHGVSGVFSVLILGVALAVAAVPEGLPAVVTAVLAIGVQRMAQRRAIIRHLAAVETLGSASAIASDKTGTLTRNEMTVRTIVTASGRVEFGGSGYAPEGAMTADAGRDIDAALRSEVVQLLTAAARANNATLLQRNGEWTAQGDPTEAALLAAARKSGLDGDSFEHRLPRVAEVPFSSERKLMSTVHRDLNGHDGHGVLFTKGAPDVVLGHCTHELVGDDRRLLSDHRRRLIVRENEALAGDAFRTLGVAMRSLSGAALEEASSAPGEQLEADLTFAGLVGIIDPPRPEARQAVERARRAGIRALMITGDHPRTAAVIAQQLGIDDSGTVLTGAELDALSPDDATRAVARVSVYARVTPAHKLRIIDALRRDGTVVAMTGDGVNDAPALKKADIGIAMGITGTDVSKQAADMILADDNFATIVAAVEEGRAVFANIRKFLRYLLSSNIGEVLTMFLGVLLARVIGLPSGTEGPGLPLLATQLLWINLVTDGAPALALGVDPPEARLMEQPPRPHGEGVLTAHMWRGIFVAGVTMAIGTLLVLDASLPGGFVAGSGTLPYGQTMAFTTLVLFQMFNVFSARSDERSAFAGMFTNRWLWAALAGSLVLQAAVVYLPVLQAAFGTTALGVTDWVLCATVASSVLWVRELTKLGSGLITKA
jgi:Ca2+-transporting ATPase